MRFVSFAEAKKKERALVAGVDCFLPGGLNLSHWRGAAPPAEVVADTSAAMVLKALERGRLPDQLRYVTNNHFDVDGFVGIWSMLHPDLALQYSDILRAMALLGDFRELPDDPTLARQALQLVCWLNTVEKKKFYAPFGMAFDEERACVPKFDYFLPVFGEMLENPALGRAVWQAEVEMIDQHLDLIGQSGSVEVHKDIRLMVVKAPQPVHYYALFGRSADVDMVLSIYPGHRYELEYKYTTWVDAYGRASFPRIDMRPLAKKLNEKEDGGRGWSGTDITDTGPILRLGPSIKNKEVRFDHPFNRPFTASAISPDELEQTIVDFFRSAYRNVEPREIWTWEETRKVNRQLAEEHH